MSQVNSTQGYASPYPNSNNPAASNGTGPALGGSEEGNGILPEDAVHLKQQFDPNSREFPRLAIKNYKKSVGQDISFVKETMRNKVAEYGLPPQTKLSVSKDVFGKLQVTGHVKVDTLERIQSDLNNNQAFKQSFDRVSLQEPTLNYLDTASKLSKAYGVGNAIVSAIVSENAEFNSLQDIAHRYEKYGETILGANSEKQGERFQMLA